MILPLLLTLVSTAAPAAPAEGPLKLALPGLHCVNVDEKACAFFGDYFAEQLASGRPLRVSTQREIAALIGFERQRELLGCAEASTSCIVELAGGLGVAGLVVGNIARFGEEFVLTLKVVSARDGAPFGSETRRVVGEKRLLDALGEVAERLALKLPLPKTAAAAPAPTVAVTPPPPEARPFLGGPQVWGTGAAGLVAAGVGAGFIAAAHGVRDELHQPASVRDEVALNQLVERGALYQGLGFGLLAAGGALVAVAGGLFAWDAAKAPRVALSWDPERAVVLTVGGTLP